MKVLGVDPGSKCGWALRDGATLLASGTWDLSARRHEGGGMRFLRLRSYLNDLLKTIKPEAVAYEEVRRHRGTDAAHVYGGIVATLSAWCEEHEIPYRGIPVGTIKKAATGHGGAAKEAMIVAARSAWPDAPGAMDDNRADALWTAETFMREFA